MKNNGFYNSIAYKERQAEIVRKNWQIGIYDSLRKREKRRCARAGCKRVFETKPSDSKRFCSQSCAAKVNNLKRRILFSPKKSEIEKLYKKGLSMMEISENLECKYGRVVYWMQKYEIPRRSRSEANYLKYNPDGDPFKIKGNLTKEEFKLKGLGLGLFWGEGCKRTMHSVRIANTDLHLIRKFIEFLTKICGVREEKIKYSLQVFNDAGPERAIKFWAKKLNISKEKIGKVSIIPPMGKGTYKKKSEYGVLTVGVYNTKLKRIFDDWIENYKTNAPR